MNKLNKYTAENKKQYSHLDGDIVTAKHKIAFALILVGYIQCIGKMRLG